MDAIRHLKTHGHMGCVEMEVRMGQDGSDNPNPPILPPLGSMGPDMLLNFAHYCL